MTIVASNKAPIVPTRTETVGSIPTPPSNVPSETPISGSATYPINRPVTVMPSWAPESMKDVRLVMARTRFACASPLSASAAMRERSTDM